MTDTPEQDAADLAYVVGAYQSRDERLVEQLRAKDAQIKVLTLANQTFVGTFEELARLHDENELLKVELAHAQTLPNQLATAVHWNEEQRTIQAKEIERLRIEMHRLAESRRGQRERAERAEAEIERLNVQYAEERAAFLAEQVAGQEALAEVGRLRAVRYLPLACPVCGRVRVEYDPTTFTMRCEKCGAEDFEPRDREIERLRAQLGALLDQMDRDLGSPREGKLSDLRRAAQIERLAHL